MELENLIIIRNGEQALIRKALDQWIALYSKQFKCDMEFKIYRNSIDHVVIEIDRHIENEFFYYLINYLQYPEGLEHDYTVMGYLTATEKNILQGKKLLVYMSEQATEYDNVYVVTSEDETFLIDFGGRVRETNENMGYELPNLENLILLATISIERNIHIEKNERNKVSGKLKRFILLVFLTLFALIVVNTIKFEAEELLNYHAIIGLAVCICLFTDYKLLQSNKLYLGALILSIIIFTYGHWLSEVHSNQSNVSIVLIGNSLPLCLLMIQKPLRFIFLKTFKREPVVDKPAPTFLDAMYIIILLLSTLFIPALYFS
ncbi:hypothetical protein GYB22_05625 [bacterium]|nr:hypothetical protein [bacterium]